jgi:hypothetical protein
MTLSAPTFLMQAEGKQLEFKRDLSSPQNVLKTLVAFANSAGGRLVIGVDDARQVVGVADPLAEKERICNLIADAIAPRLLPNVELMGVGDATVLVVEVFPSGARPHYLSKLGPEQGVYLRLGSSNRQAGRTGLPKRAARLRVWCLMSSPCPTLGCKTWIWTPWPGGLVRGARWTRPDCKPSSFCVPTRGVCTHARCRASVGARNGSSISPMPGCNAGDFAGRKRWTSLTSSKTSMPICLTP